MVCSQHSSQSDAKTQFLLLLPSEPSRLPVLLQIEANILRMTHGHDSCSDFTSYYVFPSSLHVVCTSPHPVPQNSTLHLRALVFAVFYNKILLLLISTCSLLSSLCWNSIFSMIPTGTSQLKMAIPLPSSLAFPIFPNILYYIFQSIYLLSVT